MARKISIIAIAIMLVWTGIRLVVAERVSGSVYIMAAGKDYVVQEWNYRSRFDRKPDPATWSDRATNNLNDTFFRFSRPLFRLENRLLGRTIRNGDPAYGRFVRRLDEVRYSGWDYVVFSGSDSGNLAVVKNGSIVQKID